MASYILFGIVGAVAFTLCSYTSYRRGVGDGIGEGLALGVGDVLKDVAAGNIRLVDDYVEFSGGSCLMPFSLDGTYSERVPAKDIIEGEVEEATDVSL